MISRFKSANWEVLISSSARWILATFINVVSYETAYHLLCNINVTLKKLLILCSDWGSIVYRTSVSIVTITRVVASEINSNQSRSNMVQCSYSQLYSRFSVMEEYFTFNKHFQILLLLLIRYVRI